MDKKYDYLIVGSGLYGATFAHLAAKRGKHCLVIDKRSHLGGNLYCENVEGINVHKYGAHIFHTSNKQVWDFVNSIVEFNRYTNSPIANYKGKLYNLPFNMNTFYQMWGVTTPAEAIAKIEEQKAEVTARMRNDGVTIPRNLEEQAQMLIGKDIYERLIKGYTEKQWGRKCTELPAFIIKRLPVRLVFDNNYFNDKYQGIPIGGYNKLIEGLLDGIETKIEVDFFANRSYWEGLLFSPEKSMNIIIIVLASWNIVPYGLKKKYRICLTIKGMQSSTIRIGKSPTRASSNTNILKCSAKTYIAALKLSSPKNILQNGKMEWNLTIR